MLRRLILVAVILLFVGPKHSSQWHKIEFKQHAYQKLLIVRTKSMYERALEKESSRWAMFSVIDENTGKRQPICTATDFLFRAIEAENGFSDLKRAREIALKSKDQTFHFRKKEALRFFRSPCRPEVLSKVRAIVSKISRVELIRQLQSTEDSNKPFDRYEYLNEGAQVLIENNILPRYRCAGGPLLCVGSDDLDYSDQERLNKLSDSQCK